MVYWIIYFIGVLLAFIISFYMLFWKISEGDSYFLIDSLIEALIISLSSWVVVMGFIVMISCKDKS